MKREMVTGEGRMILLPAITGSAAGVKDNFIHH